MLQPNANDSFQTLFLRNSKNLKLQGQIYDPIDDRFFGSEFDHSRIKSGIFGSKSSIFESKLTIFCNFKTAFQIFIQNFETKEIWEIMAITCRTFFPFFWTQLPLLFTPPYITITKTTCIFGNFRPEVHKCF